jgi:predicted dehydrogenase
MMRVAILGFGFMGRVHFGCWRRIRGARVVAVCTPRPEKLREKVVGNTSGPEEALDLSDVAVYRSLDDLLAAGGFDVVDITVPTALHRDLAIQALRAGVHVVCEKPMALTTRDCDAMLAAAEKAKGILMVAQCARFSPENAFLRGLVASGRYGRVVAADFTRFCAPPEWGAGKSWFLDESKSGGALIDTHVHDADLVCSLFGLPAAVTSRRHVRPDGLTDHAATVFDYPNAVVTAAVSWAATPSFLFESGYKVFFEKAVVISDAKRANAVTVFPAKGRPFAPRLSAVPSHLAELQYFMKLVGGKTPPGAFSARDARDAVHLAEAEMRSAATGRTVRLGDACRGAGAMKKS